MWRAFVWKGQEFIGEATSFEADPVEALESLYYLIDDAGEATVIELRRLEE